LPWTPQALPSVVVLTTIPERLANPEFRLAPAQINDVLAVGEQLLQLDGSTHRVHIDTKGAGRPAVLLPFDHLFDIRVTAAKRLWLALTGRKPGPNPAALSAPRRKRLTFALRALDARLQNVTYRAIAAVLFGPDRLPQRGWKAHDLRDRTIRLARLGFELMEGGYRDLLLHPYRHSRNRKALRGGDLTGL
jgi:hypothetical protein